MKADYMVLADAASAAEGKLYLHGAGWDEIITPEFPATITGGLGILLRIPWGETNEPHHIELDLQDADGQSVLPPPGALRGSMNVGRPAQLEAGSEQIVPIAISLNGTKIERPGHYVITLLLDGHEASRASFRVKLSSERHASTRRNQGPENDVIPE